MALRVALSSPEVLTPIMNSCPACCCVVKESAFARHLTAAGVGEGEGDGAVAASGVTELRVSEATFALAESGAPPVEQPTSAEAQTAAAAIRRKVPGVS